MSEKSDNFLAVGSLSLAGCVYLTTLPGLDAAMRLYFEQGFVHVAQSEQAFHGSRYLEQTLEWKDPSYTVREAST